MYLPMFMVSPSVATDKMMEQTVHMGLKMETNTGPFFLSAHPLKLRHNPFTAPPCAFTNLCTKGKYPCEKTWTQKVQTYWDIWLSCSAIVTEKRTKKKIIIKSNIYHNVITNEFCDTEKWPTSSQLVFFK